MKLLSLGHFFHRVRKDDANLSFAWANLFLGKNVVKNSAILSGISSCTAWLAWGRTCTWNFPCIYPTVKSLSSMSILARMSVFVAGTIRNFDNKLINQHTQWTSVWAKSILHEKNLNSYASKLLEVQKSFVKN